MASSFSLPSESVSSFSLPQLKNRVTSENIATKSPGGFHRPSRIVWKLSSQGKNKTDDVVSNITEKTLIAAKGDESAKDEKKEAKKRKTRFPSFSVSLGKEKIEADLLAMSGSKRSKGSAARQKKRTTDLQNSFQDDLSSFSTNNCSDSMGSRFDFVVETSENEAISSDGRRKIMWKFTASNNKNNKDMVTNAVDQNQTLVSTELEELEKAETWKNKKTVSEAVNQTLIEPEPVQPESTQPGIVPVIKENTEKTKRTFSTFSVSLSKEEIEADFVAMGGSMRTKRIKKRSKSVQRQLNDLLPGLRLKYITPDDYKVREDKN